MLTMVLQVLVTLAFLVFGVAAIAVGARTWDTARQPACAWWLTGVAFTIHGVIKGAQNGFGIMALRRGPGSETWADYLYWNPIFNQSRTFHLLAFIGVLAWLVARSADPTKTARRLGVVVMIGGIIVGGVIGGMEEEFSQISHYSAVARWDVIEMLALLAVLFAALVYGKFDRLLWFALCVYAFSLALNVLWFAALSRLQMPGEWSPRPWAMQLYRLILTIAFASIAVQRLRLARRGRRVPALIEQPPSRISTLG